MLERLAGEYDGQIAFGSVNVEECPRTVKEFRISSVPTLTLLVDGITEQRLIGLRPVSYTHLDVYKRQASDYLSD